MLSGYSLTFKIEVERKEAAVRDYPIDRVDTCYFTKDVKAMLSYLKNRKNRAPS